MVTTRNNGSSKRKQSPTTPTIINYDNNSPKKATKKRQHKSPTTSCNYNSKQSVLSQLSYLRELLHGSSYSEYDLSRCLRQCGYNMEAAAEQLITRQFAPSTNTNSSNNSSAVVTSSPINEHKQKRKENNEEKIVSIDVDDDDDDNEPIIIIDECASNNISASQISQDSVEELKPKSKASLVASRQIIPSSPLTISNNINYMKTEKGHFLLCQRWTIGFSTSRLGSIRYEENVTISTSASPFKKGANIVRFKGKNIEGTLDRNLSNIIGPLLRSNNLINVIAKGFMDDLEIRIGQEVPLNIFIYIINPTEFFNFFDPTSNNNNDSDSANDKNNCLHVAAFNLLQWGQYGDKLPVFEKVAEESTTADNDANDDIENHQEKEIEAPKWATDVYEKTNKQLPEESDPKSMINKGITLKCYQRQALHWMINRECNANNQHNKQFRDQLELLAELSSSSHQSATTTMPNNQNNILHGVECSVGPVLVSNDIASKSKSFDGIINPPLHPLWQRRFLWDQQKQQDDVDNNGVYSFYVNELLHTASIYAPNPPNQCVGGILSDAMGLGKTVMLIALIAKEKEKQQLQQRRDDKLKSITTTLVVAPLSVLTQWEEEIINKSPLSCLTYYSDQAKKLSKVQLSDADVVLTTYGMLQSEYSKNKAGGNNTITITTKTTTQTSQSLLLSTQFHRIILDEAHIIKNPNTGASKACCAVQADNRWCVTGTPISNSLQDIYGLLKFLKHEPWCQASFWKKAITCAKPTNDETSKEENEDNMAISLDRVRRLLEPILLRRTKDTLTVEGEPILKLPPVESKIISIELSHDERVFYNALLNKSQTIFDGFIQAGTASKSWFAIFSLLQRLRQACDHLALSIKPRLDDDEPLKLTESNKVGEGNAVSNTMHDQFLIDLLESSKQDDSSGQYSQNVVQSLTQSILGNDTLQEECAICLEIINRDNLAVTPCHHMFCKTCLIKTLKATSSKSVKKCPVCAEEISEEKLICRTVQVKHENAVDSESYVESSKVQVKDLKGILYASIDGKCSSKIISMFEELDLIWLSDPGSKVLIFSQYLGMLDLIQSQMKERHIRSYRLDGSLSLNDRRKTLSSFNSCASSTLCSINGTSPATEEKDMVEVKRGSVLLASMKACGLGMNLTCASSVFILDPWWNDAQEDQCINRIHRIGQTAKVVRVRKFIVSDSVEEKMVKMQERKKGVASEVLSDKSTGMVGASSNPSLDELRIIFG